MNSWRDFYLFHVDHIWLIIYLALLWLNICFIEDKLKSQTYLPWIYLLFFLDPRLAMQTELPSFINR